MKNRYLPMKIAFTTLLLLLLSVVISVSRGVDPVWWVKHIGLPGMSIVIGMYLIELWRNE